MVAACQPGAVHWIEAVFSDCVYSPRDLLGFCVGLLSIACWLLAQVPQLVKNYRTQSAEALSPWFLAEWLLGDTFNLLGSLLKGDQPQSVVLTAQYFVLMDVVLLVQYLYYQSLARRRERLLQRRSSRRRHHHHPHHHHQQQQQQAEGELMPEIVTAGPGPSLSAAAAGGAAAGSSGSGARDVSFRPTRVVAPLIAASLMIAQTPRLVGLAAGAAGGTPAGAAARRLLAFSTPGVAGLGVTLPAWSHTAGSVLGYASSVLYLSSRVSQILQNWRRRSVEGLAMSMFLFAILANSCYGGSILIRTYTWEQLTSSMPWLIGSLGTVALDVTIFAQSRLLGDGGGKKRESDEEEPMLVAEDKEAGQHHAHHHHAHVHG